MVGALELAWSLPYLEPGRSRFSLLFESGSFFFPSYSLSMFGFICDENVGSFLNSVVPGCDSEVFLLRVQLWQKEFMNLALWLVLMHLKNREVVRWDHPGMYITTRSLNGTNYLKWSQSARIFIGSRKLNPLSHEEPSEATFEKWEDENLTVKSLFSYQSNLTLPPYGKGGIWNRVTEKYPPPKPSQLQTKLQAYCKFPAGEELGNTEEHGGGASSVYVIRREGKIKRLFLASDF